MMVDTNTLLKINSGTQTNFLQSPVVSPNVVTSPTNLLLQPAAIDTVELSNKQSVQGSQEQKSSNTKWWVLGGLATAAVLGVVFRKNIAKALGIGEEVASTAGQKLKGAVEGAENAATHNVGNAGETVVDAASQGVGKAEGAVASSPPIKPSGPVIQEPTVGKVPVRVQEPIAPEPQSPIVGSTPPVTTPELAVAEPPKVPVAVAEPPAPPKTTTGSTEDWIQQQELKKAQAKEALDVQRAAERALERITQFEQDVNAEIKYALCDNAIDPKQAEFFEKFYNASLEEKTKLLDSENFTNLPTSSISRINSATGRVKPPKGDPIPHFDAFKQKLNEIEEHKSLEHAEQTWEAKKAVSTSIVNNLKREGDKELPLIDRTFTEKEGRVIEKYINCSEYNMVDAYTVNNVLRQDGFEAIMAESAERGPRPSRMLCQIEGLDQIIENAPKIPEEAVVYRALGSDAKFVEPMKKVGNIVTDHGFVSTTMYSDAEYLYQFSGGKAPIMRIKLPKGTKGIDMRNSHYEDSVFAQEFLLPRSSQFKITGFNPETKIIDCDYILPEIPV